jgi:hypothetical protein
MRNQHIGSDFDDFLKEEVIEGVKAFTAAMRKAAAAYRCCG